MADRSTADGSRRQQLLGVKLRALVGDHLAQTIEAVPQGIPNGSALVHDDAAWVLIDGDATRSLGAALAWTVRQGASSLDVIAGSGGGTVARRAAGLSMPTNVWFAEERLLLPTVAEPLPDIPRPRTDLDELTQMMVVAGAVPNTEHGVVFGEVRGLEVCRIVDQPTSGFFTEEGEQFVPPPEFADGQLRLEVGVGAADREAFHMLHGNIPTADALAGVVQAVVTHRSLDAPQHPLNRLGRERFLRWQAEQRPDTVGMVAVRPAEPPVPRPNLKDPVPCVAHAATHAGETALVVFSSGVDLDLVPYVVDVQATAPATRIIVALPPRDLLPLTRDLAALLITPIDFVTLDDA